MNVNFADGLIQAYKTKWSYINTFHVEIEFAGPVAKIAKWANVKDKLNLAVVSVNTPQFTNSPIEAFVAGKWRIHTGKDELYTFEITFRDFDQMKLYESFYTAYMFQKYNYFNDVKSTVTIWKDADHYGETQNKLFEFKDSIISSVSQLQFSNNTENQIAEFSVTFKTAIPVIDKTVAHPAISTDYN